MLINTKLVYAILGDIARKFNNQVSLGIINSYLRDYNQKTINSKDLDQFISNLSDKDSSAHKIYMSVKEGSETIESVLGLTSSPVKIHYVNTRDEVLSIPTTELDKVVMIVRELENASPSKSVSWRKVRAKAKELDLVFSPSKDFRELVMRRKDELEQSPRQELSATEQQFVNKAFGSELGEYQIKKRELQNKNRELNKLQRKLTDQTIFSQELIKSISRPRVIRTNRYVKDKINGDKNDTLIVITSDWHIGAKVELKNNEYSYAIAQQRLDKYIQAICQAVQLYKPSNIKIINLGDLIENSQMRQNQGYYTEFELSNQIVKATELQDSFLSSLAISFPNIQFEFTELAGNHDRFAPNKKDQLYGDSVAVVARELTKSFKNTNKAMTNFKVINPDTEYRHIINVQGHNLAFVHGDLDKVNDNNCLAKVGAFEHTTLDALVGGHLHSLMIRENNGLIIQSGSLIGPTEYSDRLGCYASASQVMLNVTPETITPLIVNL